MCKAHVLSWMKHHTHFRVLTCPADEKQELVKTFIGHVCKLSAGVFDTRMIEAGKDFMVKMWEIDYKQQWFVAKYDKTWNKTEYTLCEINSGWIGGLPDHNNALEANNWAQKTGRQHQKAGATQFLPDLFEDIFNKSKRDISWAPTVRADLIRKDVNLTNKAWREHWLCPLKLIQDVPGKGRVKMIPSLRVVNQAVEQIRKKHVKQQVSVEAVAAFLNASNLKGSPSW
eukprot:3777934-Rhodomonas_salina.1